MCLRRNGSGVLHDPRRGFRSRAGTAWRRGPGSGAESGRGSALIEILISLSILTIGVFAIVGLLGSARRSAEAAAGSAAAALAAQQVLETSLAGRGPGAPYAGDVPVGVHRVRVTLVAEPAASGLIRLRAHAVDRGSRRAWDVETLRAGP
jgi:hypothetical protein